MLAKVLKGNQIFIPIFIIVLWLVGVIFMNKVDFTNMNQLTSLGLLASISAPSSLIINNFPYFKKNFFFTFLFLLGTLFVVRDLNNVSIFAGLFFLFIIILQTLATAQYSFSVLNDFDLGFLLGVAILLHPPLWIFSIYLVLYFIFSGKTSPKNLLLVLFGLLTFGLLFIQIIAIFDLWEIWETIKESFLFNLNTYDSFLLFLTLILIPFGVGLLDYFTKLNRQSVDKKIVFSSSLLLFLVGVVYFVLYGSNLTLNLIPMLVGVFIYLSNYLSFSHNFKTKEFLLWITILGFALFRFGHLINLPEVFNSVTF